MEPVIYCVVACLALLDGTAHRSLAQVPGAEVMAIEAGAFAALLGKSQAPPILYFSPDAYAEAADGLSAEELQEMVERRRRDWSPRALDQATDWLFQRGQSILTLAAAAQGPASATPHKALAAHFSGLVDLLMRLNGEGRFGAVRLDELLIFALEAEAALIEELAGAPDATRFAAEIAERTETAQLLAAALARNGHSEYAQSLPYSELWRGVLISPADTALLSRLRTQWEPSAPWRDGLVARQRLRDLPRLQQEGRQTKLVYLNAGQFLDDISELTPAQLDRRFARQADELAVTSEHAYDVFLSGLRLDALLTLKRSEDRADQDAPALARLLKRRVSVATDRLAATLGRTAGVTASHLVAAETEWLSDMRSLSAWSSTAGRATLAGWLRGWSDQLEPQIARLAAMPTPP